MSDQIDRKAFVARIMRDAQQAPAAPAIDEHDPDRRRERAVLSIFERVVRAGELTGDAREAVIDETLDLIHADPGLARSFANFRQAMSRAPEGPAATPATVPGDRAAPSLAARLGSVADRISARLQGLLTRWEGEWTLTPGFAASRSRGLATEGPRELFSDIPGGTYRLGQMRFPDPASGLIEVVFQVYRPGSFTPLVTSRDAWRIVPVLDGKELPVVPEAPDPAAWKLADLISTDDLERLSYDVAVLPPDEVP